MSWDIVLFNSKQKIESISKLDESQLETTDFIRVLEGYFDIIIKNGNHRELIGNDFSIDFFIHKEHSSSLLLSLNGVNGLFELIELSKKHNWQIYDSWIDVMIDLENPEKNGYDNHRKYVEQILKNK
jgi:hypothetical protein